MAKKGTGKSTAINSRVALIQAKSGTYACQHGSIYCRMCFGWNIQEFSKSDRKSGKRKNIDGKKKSKSFD